MGSKNGPGTPVVHRAPRYDEDGTYPCCKMEIKNSSPNTLVVQDDDLVTCDGTPPAAGQRVDYNIIDEAHRYIFGAPSGAEGPPRGEQGHECITDADMMEISSILEKIAMMAKAHRERLLRMGFEEVHAQGLAAHAHAVMVSGIFGR